MVVKCTVVYLQDHMADWKLQLTATAQHQKGGSYGIALARGKIKIQIGSSGF